DQLLANIAIQGLPAEFKKQVNTQEFVKALRGIYKLTLLDPFLASMAVLGMPEDVKNLINPKDVLKSLREVHHKIQVKKEAGEKIELSPQVELILRQAFDRKKND